MPYAYDMLGNLGQHWLSQPATPGLDIPPDPFVRERGAANLNLIPTGRAAIHQVGAGFAQHLGAAALLGHPREVKIFTSPWSRATETAHILAQHLAPFSPKVITIPELAPQSLGGMEGQPREAVAEQKNELNTLMPQNEPPGQSPFTGAFGESRDHYAARLLPAIQAILDEAEHNPNLLSIVAAHSGDMKLIQGSRGENDRIENERTDRMVFDGQRWRYERGVAPSAQPGVWLQRHGTTEFNVARPEMNTPRSGRPLDPTNPSSAGNSSGTPPSIE